MSAVSAFTITSPCIRNQLRSDVIVAPLQDKGVHKKRIAVWDTGAMKTTVSKEVAAELGLEVVSYRNVSTPNGNSQAACYYVDIVLPNKVVVSKVLVLEGTLCGFDVLVGMDIIGLGDFAVTNFNQQTAFTFRIPSLMKFDFCKKSYREPFSKESTVGVNDLCPCGSGKKYKKCCQENNEK